MLENPRDVINDALSDTLLGLLNSSHSKSLPDLHQTDPTSTPQRLPSRVFTSTFQISGPRAFFLTPIGPNQSIHYLGDSVFGGQVYAPSKAHEKYLTAQVKVSTHLLRPHEFEDLQKPLLRRSADFFFYRQNSPKKKVISDDFPEVELSTTSTGLSNILPAQPQDSSLALPSVEDQEEKLESPMAVPTQYAVEHQLNGSDEAAGVIAQRTASFNDLRRKFEEARTMYLPRDPNVLKEKSGAQKRERRSQSVGPLKSRPRSAVYEQRVTLTPSPVKRPDSLRSLVGYEQQYTPEGARNGYSRNFEIESRRRSQREERWSMGHVDPRTYDYSPTKRRLVGIRRNASPRSMNRAACGNDWPDGIFTKTGDVYKRINNGSISYIIPTSPDGASQSRIADYRRDQLTVDCSEQNYTRSPSPQMKDRPSPCLNYSYLEHIDVNGPKPYRSVTLSDWKGVSGVKKSTSCLNLHQPEVFHVKRYSIPRAANGNNDAWKSRAQETGESKQRYHSLRESWSPLPICSSSRSVPSDFEELTEREVRNRAVIKDQWLRSPRQEPYRPTPSPYLMTPDGVDESSISRNFESNIALFEKLAIENKKEALCTKCTGCCVHSSAARQPYPSRRLFSTRRARSDRNHSIVSDIPPFRQTSYRGEKGGYDRYHGNGAVEVVKSPGGRMYSRSLEPYLSP